MGELPSVQPTSLRAFAVVRNWVLEEDATKETGALLATVSVTYSRQ